MLNMNIWQSIMVEKIDIQNRFSTVSGTKRLKGINRQNGNLPQRRFREQLKEEEENKKNNDKRKIRQPSDLDGNETNYALDHNEKRARVDILNEKKDENKHGRIIDIHI